MRMDEISGYFFIIFNWQTIQNDLRSKGVIHCIYLGLTSVNIQNFKP